MMKDVSVCLDFDGVCHMDKTGWHGFGSAPEDPVPGALSWIVNALEECNVDVYSFRSQTLEGRQTMISWFKKHFAEFYRERGFRNPVTMARDTVDEMGFPKFKPPAHVYIDDRAWLFSGKWPDLEDVLKFERWTKKEQRP